MLFKNISIVNEDMSIRNGVDVLIEGDRIQSIRPSEESQEGEGFEGSSYIMIPGFVNAHGHSPMSLMRGYGENLNLQDWLFTRIFPFEDQLDSEAVYYGTLLSLAESFKYGIVSTSDMYFFVEDMVSAYRDAGAKGNISRSIANPGGIPFEELPSIKETIDVEKKYNGACDGKIIIEGSLHAEYVTNEETAIRLGKLCKEMGMRMHVHISETEREHRECKERNEGRTPTRFCLDAGLFDVPALAAHCVYVEPEDIKILGEKKVTVATNPVSNMKLASGICDVKTLLDSGINVALGTDSSASNNNLNIMEEMKTMLLLAKLKNMNPEVLSPEKALYMATRAGALAQGREDCGFIKEGAKADLVLIKRNSPNMKPCYDMLSNLVLASDPSDIYLTMVDGRIVYRDGEYPTLDLEDIEKGVEESVKRILARL